MPVMAAFKAATPLEETTRHNIRWTRSKDSQVFMVEKRPLSPDQIDVSPPQRNQTFLVMEPGDLASELRMLRHEVNNLQKEVQDLKTERHQKNEDLYRPLFASRELAIVSLLMHQRDRLDKIVMKVIQVKACEIEKDPKLANRRERKEVRKAFLKQFGESQRMSYFQLARASENNNKQAFFEVLSLAEQEFLDEYESQGFRYEESIDVRTSMRALRFAKKCRDQNAAHLFDFNYREKGKESVKEQRTAWQVQASVLLDLQTAVREDWLLGVFKTLGNPTTGTLQLEISRRIAELEDESGLSIKDLAELS